MSGMCDAFLARERLTLSKYAALTANTKGRQHPYTPCPTRTEYQRDRDRILHSKSFRRLMHKTQVFLNPEGDHYRTRMTHTLEVTRIARTIARGLHLNEDLTEAIGLGHDLGHTPFGHAGERVLNEIMPGGFEHNEQSLRVVDRLEKDGKCSLKGFGELRSGAHGTLAFAYNPAIGGEVLDGNIDSRVAEATPIATPSAAKPQPKQVPAPIEEDVQIEVVPRKPQIKAEQRVDAVQPATSRKSDAERRPRSQEEYVKGLRYGKGRKVVTGREGATSRKSSKGDMIIKVAIAAAVVAILALCYGFWNDWRQSRMDEPYIDNSLIYEQEPQSAEGEVRNPDLDYITPKEN